MAMWRQGEPQEGWGWRIRIPGWRAALLEYADCARGFSCAGVYWEELARDLEGMSPHTSSARPSAAIASTQRTGTSGEEPLARTATDLAGVAP